MTTKKKRPRAKKLPRHYKGYMEFPLIGADTHEQFSLSTRYFGDFAHIPTRCKILGRDRSYRVELHLRIIDSTSGGWSIVDMTPDRALNRMRLAELVHYIATEEVDKLIRSKMPVNVDNSYVKIIL